MTTYILGARRTPIGSFQGSLAGMSAPELGARAIQSTLSDSGIDPETVDEVYIGNVVSAGLRQAPARQALRQAGLPDRIPATTVNKVCGSGMKATMIGSDLISLKHAKCVISGGMESMSNMPYLLPKARRGLRINHHQILDSMFIDGLEDAETQRTMGDYAQQVADEYQVTREHMDQYAVGSVTKALTAMESGVFQNEIVPLGSLEEDEQPRKSKIETIPKMRPAFSKQGTITAASTSSISDGASALVLGDERLTAKLSIEPLCRIVGQVSIALAPKNFVLAPIYAIQQLLETLNWSTDTVDVFEINEAFAVVTMLAIRELNLDPDKVNLYGGACAQGHPLGSTGSRLIVTLAQILRAKGLRRGVASLCIGGGEGTAIALERD